MQQAILPQVAGFENITRRDVARFGGKNASLGEMLRTLGGAGVRVPPGFATTADAYWRYVEANGLEPQIDATLAAQRAGEITLQQAGQRIRAAFLGGAWPPDTAQQILAAYAELSRQARGPSMWWFVPAIAGLARGEFRRPAESFQWGGDAALLDACRRCYASLYTDRRSLAAWASPTKIAPSVGVQKMVYDARRWGDVLDR
jgi:pyruvate,water dikinase